MRGERRGRGKGEVMCAVENSKFSAVQLETLEIPHSMVSRIQHQLVDDHHQHLRLSKRTNQQQLDPAKPSTPTTPSTPINDSRCKISKLTKSKHRRQFLTTNMPSARVRCTTYGNQKTTTSKSYFPALPYLTFKPSSSTAGIPLAHSHTQLTPSDETPPQAEHG